MFTPQEFNRHVQLAYGHVENGNRKSPNRLYLLQQHVATVSRSLLPGLIVEAPNLQTIDGYFHQKQFPIVIRQNGNPICCIGTTFTLGSYASNIYNYFQEITGEAVNMQLEEVRYCSIWVIPTRIRKRRRNGTIFFQTVTQNHFQKFFRLMQTNGPFRPFAIGCFIIDIDYETNEITPANTATLFNQENLALYNDNLSMTQFFDKIREVE